MKRLTPKQKVLRKWPSARARWWTHSRYYSIDAHIKKPMPQWIGIGRGETIDLAWADAARRLEKRNG